MLIEDNFLSRMEDVLFLNVKNKMTFFIAFHANHELVKEISVQWKIFWRLYKKLLNVFFWNKFLRLYLFLDKFICIFDILKESKWNWMFILEIDLMALNILSNILNLVIINIHHSCHTLLSPFFKLRSQLLTLIGGQSV